jgi:hypothetical protein
MVHIPEFPGAVASTFQTWASFYLEQIEDQIMASFYRDMSSFHAGEDRNSECVV